MSVPATAHASAVVVGGHGVLIRGASGSGKSSLVLGLIDAQSPPAMLVADDRVRLSVRDGRLVASAPAALAGKLEIRGLGIVDYPHRPESEVALVVDLLAPAECPRFPAAEDMSVSILGIEVPRLRLPVGAADGPARVRAALRRLGVAARA